MKEAIWEEYKANSYYWRFYLMRPISPNCIRALNCIAWSLEFGDDAHMRRTLEQIDTMCLNFENTVNDLKFGWIADFDHKDINGKTSHLRNSGLAEAENTGYIQNAVDVIATELANCASSCSLHYAKTVVAPEQFEAASSLIEIFLIAHTAATINSLMHNAISKAFQDGCSNQLISDATNLRRDTIKKITANKKTTLDTSRRYRSLKDFNWEEVIPERASETSLAETPSPRTAKQIVTSIAKIKPDLLRCANAIVDDLWIHLLPYKNVEINAALSPDDRPTLSDPIELRLLSEIKIGLDDIVLAERNTLLARGWSSNTLAVLLPGGKNKIQRDSPKINSQINDQIRPQLNTGKIHLMQDSGNEITFSIDGSPVEKHPNN